LRLLRLKTISNIAIERKAARSKRLKENLERLGFDNNEDESDACHCDVVVQEGQTWTPSSFMAQQDGDTLTKDDISGILLDTPCSATGTGSRRPDVLRKDLSNSTVSGGSELAGLLDIQQTLLLHCVDNILPVGGILVYATCSLMKRESEDQILTLLQRKDSLVTVEVLPMMPGEISGFDGAIDAENGWMRVLPGQLDGELRKSDGFFVARLIRTA
jgi:16S rRNA (cytosine967-C5)-methyltransferase